MTKKNPASKYDHVILALERGDLVRGLTEREWADFKTIVTGAEAGKRKYLLTFHGYDDDPRDVWQFKEVTDFCLRVMRECPALYAVGDDTTRTVLLYATSLRLFTGERMANPGWASVEPNLNQIRLTTQW